MPKDRNRPSQDIAGIAGGGLEDERESTPSSEPVTRSVAEDRGVRKPVDKLNDSAVAPEDDPTRTITGRTDRE